MTAGVLLLSTLVAPSAQAQSLDLVDEGVVLPRGEPGTYYEHNVGSPSVTYDPDADQFVLFFEYRGAWGTPSRCAGSAGTEWGIGRATSPDGLTWTVDATPALAPTSGDWWSCAAVHPSVVYEGPGQWHLWFKGIDETGAVGVGYASSADGVSFTPSSEPALSVQDDPTPEDFGWPRVVQVSGTWLLFMNYGDNGITVASASAPQGPWRWEGADGRTALATGGLPWMEDELIVADVACRDEPASHPFDLMFGAHDRDPANFWGTPVTRSVVWATGQGVEDWLMPESPVVTWDAAEIDANVAWRSWSALPLGTDDYVFFYQRHDGSGNQIGLAHTTADTNWDRSQFRGDICTYAGQAPVGEPDAYEATAGISLTVAAPGVLANDADPERNRISATLVDAPSLGTLTLDAGGGFTYAAAWGQEGEDAFTYVATDGTSESRLVTVTLTVLPGESPPPDEEDEEDEDEEEEDDDEDEEEEDDDDDEAEEPDDRYDRWRRWKRRWERWRERIRDRWGRWR